MAKLTREAQKVFANASNTNEKAAFGTMKTGTPVYSTDLATLQTSDYEQGWQNGLLVGKAPFLEEMNGVQYGLSKQIAYLLQAGISEWLATDTYYQDDYVRVGHDIFYSNTDDNIGNNPEDDNVNWTHAGNYDTATSTTSGLTKLYSSTGDNTDGTMTQQAITNALPVQATSTNLGTVKLYAESGTNTDGAMTQASATSTFQGKLTAGTNITINDENVISTTGGSGSGIGVAIGTIFSVACSSSYVPDGALPCDGTQYSNTQFSDFFTNYLVAGLLNTCTFSDYSSDISTYGQCGKFAIDTTTGNFRVPLIKDGSYLTQALSDSELGKSYNESLPNIAGKLTFHLYAGSTDGTSNGALYSVKTTGSSGIDASAADRGQYRTFGIDASRSSSTYQDGAKVQGDNVRVRFFVQVANGQINESQMDWSAWASGLEGKINTDHSNDTVPYLKETFVDGTSGYNIWSNGYCEQWGIITTPTSSGSASGNLSISFLKTFSDENYIFTFSGQASSAVSGTNYIRLCNFGYTTKTTSSISGNCAYISSGGDDFKAGLMMWKVSGYLTEGEY